VFFFCIGTENGLHTQQLPHFHSEIVFNNHIWWVPNIFKFPPAIKHGLLEPLSFRAVFFPTKTSILGDFPMTKHGLIYHRVPTPHPTNISQEIPRISLDHSRHLRLVLTTIGLRAGWTMLEHLRFSRGIMGMNTSVTMDKKK